MKEELYVTTSDLDVKCCSILELILQDLPKKLNAKFDSYNPDGTFTYVATAPDGLLRYEINVTHDNVVLDQMTIEEILTLNRLKRFEINVVIESEDEKEIIETIKYNAK